MTGAVTGTAQTGLTTPTYTLTADQALDNRSKQSVVTALGGTQTNVAAHSVNAPFTVTVKRPSLLRTLSSAVLNGITGQYSKVPYNEYIILVRKGAQIAANQWYTADFRTVLRVPAGSETYDAINLRAGLSCLFGFLSGNSSGVGDTITTGVQ